MMRSARHLTSSSRLTASESMCLTIGRVQQKLVLETEIAYQRIDYEERVYVVQLPRWCLGVAIEMIGPSHHTCIGTHLSRIYRNGDERVIGGWKRHSVLRKDETLRGENQGA